MAIQEHEGEGYGASRLGPCMHGGPIVEALKADPVVEALKEPFHRSAVLALAHALAAPVPDGEKEQEDSEGLYGSAPALIRYLRARDWDVHRAEQMVRATAKWRKSFGFRALCTRAAGDAALVAREAAEGKLYVRGYDKRGRPVIYMKPRKDTFADPEASVRHMVYNMERAVACLDRQEARGNLEGDINDTLGRKVVLIIDFTNTSLLHTPPMSVALGSLRILQDHYPERLAQSFIIDAPWVMSAFFTAVWPFIDPVTREKVQFVSEEGGGARAARLAKYFDLAELEQEVGGTVPEPFLSHIYLRAPQVEEPSLSSTQDAAGAAPRGEFGFEFNEQLRLFGPGPPEKGEPGGSGANEALRSVWAIMSEPRVLALPTKERALARALGAALLSPAGHGEDGEDPIGLFDDVGALLRYLRSEAWSRERAEARLRSTARWRKEFGLAGLLAGTRGAAQLEREGEVGRLFVRGYDALGRPVLHARFDKADLGSHEDALLLMVYCVERAAACADRSEAKGADGKFTLLADFTGYSRRNRPRLRTLTAMVRILQEHYPERLGSAFLVNPPAQVLALWRSLAWLVSPDTFQKVHVVTCAAGAFPAGQLQGSFDKEAWERATGGSGEGGGGGGGSPYRAELFLAEGGWGLELNAQARAASEAAAAEEDRRRRPAQAASLPCSAEEQAEVGQRCDAPREQASWLESFFSTLIRSPFPCSGR